MIFFLSTFLLILGVLSTIRFAEDDKIFWLLSSLLSVSGLPIALSLFPVPKLIIDISIVIAPWLVFIVQQFYWNAES
ncbi:hypothetical protein ASG24_04435 [Methylophilus sp. Leaf414]|nr:hypothetical protein ASG24_04435 [Methylophilus sp. Leaf414]